MAATKNDPDAEKEFLELVRGQEGTLADDQRCSKVRALAPGTAPLMSLPISGVLSIENARVCWMDSDCSAVHLVRYLCASEPVVYLLLQSPSCKGSAQTLRIISDGCDGSLVINPYPRS